MKLHATILVILLLTFSPAALAEEGEGQGDESPYRCQASLETCLNWMAKNYIGRGWSGMHLDTTGGIYTVTDLESGSPAERKNVRPGDILVAINGVEFKEENQEKLAKLQGKMKPGAQFTYTLKRKGKRRNVEVVLVEMPIEVAAQLVGMHLLTDHVDVAIAFPGEE